MHSLLHPLLLLTTALTHTTHATPTPPITPAPQTLNISSTPPSTLPTSLHFDPPEGPRGFSCLVVALSPLPIQPKEIFITVIEMLQNITQADFNSRMAQASTTFTGPGNLAIVVDSVNPEQPVFRRYVMWALVRIMITMAREQRVGYHAAMFEPYWQGRKVGTIHVAYSQAPPAPSGTPAATLPVPATTVSDDGISWIYRPGGPLMTQWNVAMTTIGSLIQAARLPDHNLDRFRGDWVPDFGAVCLYRPLTNPSRLSKSILIRSMAGAAVWALNDGEFHALEVRVFDGVEEIAYGGYDQPVPVPPSHGVDVSSS